MISVHFGDESFIYKNKLVLLDANSVPIKHEYLKICILLRYTSLLILQLQRVKSDRINALRKQYDAFLEEDKKRKERNEFILGRLDKMRYSTALVSVRQKPATFDSRQGVANHLGYRLENPSVCEFQPSLTNQSQLFPDIQNNEDTCLIQEISKKYILIPKLNSSLMNSYIQNETLNQNTDRVREMHVVQDTNSINNLKPNTVDNTDWKTKYEILNILKNEEKEKQVCESNPGYENVSEPIKNDKSLLESNHEQVAIKYNNNINTEVHAGTTKTYVNELPEKDLTAASNVLTFEQNSLKYNDKYNPYNNVNANLIPKENSYDENNLTTSNDIQANVDYKLQNIKLDAPQSTEVSNYETQPEYHVIMSSTDADVSLEQSVETNREIVNVESAYSVEVDSAIHEHEVSVEQPKPADTEQPVYLDEDEVSPIQIINPDGLVKDINYTSSEEDHSTQQAEPVIEQLENVEEITGSIADFEAEQGNMFYSEEIDKQSDAAYNLDYSQNVYQQNQGYGYFEGTQDYPVGIHDEGITQRYESNYEEQYGRLDEGLEQQPYQEIERVHLNQAELGQYEQQLENPAQIEEMLDVEDRYIPQQPEAEAVETQQKVEGVETQHKEESMETQLKEEDPVETQYKEEAVEKQNIVENVESEKPDAEQAKASEQVYNK